MEANINQNSGENNNTLSIIDESISKEKHSENKIQTPNENIPIKEIKYFKTAEEYYSYNYPEYKLFKIGNILFCKMGNLITFGFDKNKNFKPKFSIGPNWYMTIVLITMILVITMILYSFIIRKLPFIYRISIILSLLITLFCIIKTALMSTEVAMNKYQDSYNNNYCDKCKIYFNNFDIVRHCDLCKLCYVKLDHHCVWVGKCVGKDNLCSFFEMLIFGGIFYLFLIASVIIYYIRK